MKHGHRWQGGLWKKFPSEYNRIHIEGHGSSTNAYRLAERFGVHRTTIWAVLRNDTWKESVA